MTVQIPLTRGLVALVDDADAGLVSQHTWAAQTDGVTPYARRGVRLPDGRWTTQFMHTFLTGWPQVDHRNGDGLDNRRSNLRAATSQQNHRNRRKSRGTSRFKGVCWHAENAKWYAGVTIGGRRRWLGYFRHEREAGLAYDAAAREHFGEFAALNFPLPGERGALE